jgi:hypothetical protein
MRSMRAALGGVGIILAVAFGCSSDKSKEIPGVPVTTTLSADRQRQMAELQTQLDTVKDLDAAGFASKYALPFTTTLSYDPLTAANLDRIKASSFALAANEEAALEPRGFVTTPQALPQLHLRLPEHLHG